MKRKPTYIVYIPDGRIELTRCSSEESLGRWLRQHCTRRRNKWLFNDSQEIAIAVA